MKCPVDNTDLLMTARDGVEIDYCPKCRGVWLDRGELDKILDRAMDEMTGPPPGAPGYGPPGGPGEGGPDGPGGYRGPRQSGGPRYPDDGRYPPDQGSRWGSGPDRGGYDPRGSDPRSMDPRDGPGYSDGPGGPSGGRQRSIFDIFNI